MAQFNRSYGWGNTIADTVKEYRRMQEEFFGDKIGLSIITVMEEYQKTGGGGLEERWLNQIMAEGVEDMEIARDFFRRHDEKMKEWYGPDYISYPKEMGVI